MTKDEALKLALSALNEVRQETFRLMRDGQTLYSEKKVWEAIYTIKKVLAQPQKDLEDININITWNENSMRDFGKDELNFARAILRKAQEK